MIRISPTLSIDEAELDISFIRSPGPGGQNVNKVASAVQLRFDVRGSGSLPVEIRERFLRMFGSKITGSGEIIIKATRHRTQEGNKQDAIERLVELIRQASVRPKKRKKTRPSKGSVEKRLNTKKLRGKSKALRAGRSL